MAAVRTYLSIIVVAGLLVVLVAGAGFRSAPAAFADESPVPTGGGTLTAHIVDAMNEAAEDLGQDVDGSQEVSENANTAWNLILVNFKNPLPEGYGFTLGEVEEGKQVDERCVPELQKMLADCRLAGGRPVICSAYRTQQIQEELYAEQIKVLEGQGYSSEEAPALAGRSVAVPGTSEHQLGLAVDVVDGVNSDLTKEQEQTATQQWLMENSWRYGFILRYPDGKSDITGIIYEPWHYRYVGVEAAQEIYEQGVCLEEYLEQRA